MSKNKKKKTVKKYRIPVIWEVMGYVEVKAESIDDAIYMASEEPLPKDSEYIEGSFIVDCESVYEEYPEE